MTIWSNSPPPYNGTLMVWANLPRSVIWYFNVPLRFGHIWLDLDKIKILHLQKH